MTKVKMKNIENKVFVSINLYYKLLIESKVFFGQGGRVLYNKCHIQNVFPNLNRSESG